jgi:hypothetical protein
VCLNVLRLAGSCRTVRHALWPRACSATVTVDCNDGSLVLFKRLFTKTNQQFSVKYKCSYFTYRFRSCHRPEIENISRSRHATIRTKFLKLVLLIPPRKFSWPPNGIRTGASLTFTRKASFLMLTGSVAVCACAVHQKVTC